MIIDASVGVKWLVVEEDTEAAVDLLDIENLRVPALFFSEVCNAIVKKARRGEVELDQLVGAVRSLDRLVTVADDRAHLATAMELAQALHHSVYDCVYLALAIAEDSRLVTADRKFAAKVATSPYVASLVLLGELG